MSSSAKGLLLRGFDTGEFRKAVLSFLREKCPEELSGTGDIPVSFGLQVIKKFIETKKASGLGIATATA